MGSTSSMVKTWFAALLVMLSIVGATPSLVFAQEGSEAYIYQTGDFNQGTIHQQASLSWAQIYQLGSDNEAYTYQSGESNWTLQAQIGSTNRAWAGLAGSSNSVLQTQLGDGNLLFAWQSGSNNVLIQNQIGSDNAAAAWITGSSNSVTQIQLGTAHVSRVAVFGTANNVHHIQFGYNSVLELMHIGDNATISAAAFANWEGDYREESPGYAGLCLYSSGSAHHFPAWLRARNRYSNPGRTGELCVCVSRSTQ